MAVEERQSVEEEGGRDGVKFDGHGQQQALGAHPSGGELLAEAFVPDPLVCRPAVEQHEARVGLEQRVDPVGEAHITPADSCLGRLVLKPGRRGWRGRRNARCRCHGWNRRGHRPKNRERRSDAGFRRWWGAARNGRYFQILSPLQGLCQDRPCNRPPGKFPQPLENRANDERAHLRFVAKAHLALRRMHVHVDCRGIDLEEEKRQGIASLRERLMVTLDERVAERAAVNRPLIHKSDHLVPGGPPHPGPADESAQAQPGLRRFDHQQCLRHLPPENFRHALGRRRAFRRTEDYAPVLDQGERRLRTGERIQPYAMNNVRTLGGVALQKFAPRRHGVKEM